MGGEVSATELERKDEEAQGLCHEMTQRLKLLHEEKTALSSDLRTLSATRSSSSTVSRLVATDNAMAAMATSGVVGVFAGVALARFLAARRGRSRLRRRQQ
ncbi:unnamed protein product, partial [Ectocarpus sp. 8 AP-2014]